MSPYSTAITLEIALTELDELVFKLQPLCFIFHCVQMIWKLKLLAVPCQDALIREVALGPRGLSS